MWALIEVAKLEQDDCGPNKMPQGLRKSMVWACFVSYWGPMESGMKEA